MQPWSPTHLTSKVPIYSQHQHVYWSTCIHKTKWSKTETPASSVVSGNAGVTHTKNIFQYFSRKLELPAHSCTPPLKITRKGLFRMLCRQIKPDLWLLGCKMSSLHHFKYFVKCGECTNSWVAAKNVSRDHSDLWTLVSSEFISSVDGVKCNNIPCRCSWDITVTRGRKDDQEKMPRAAAVSSTEAMKVNKYRDAQGCIKHNAVRSKQHSFIAQLSARVQEV